jgi:DNA replication protein DnaC
MNTQTAVLETAAIAQQCKFLHLPAVAAQCAHLAEQAVRERRTHLGFLEALLQAELEEREQRLVARRIREAHLPRIKPWMNSILRETRRFRPNRFMNSRKALISCGLSRSFF